MRSIDDEAYEELLKYRSIGSVEQCSKLQRLVEAYDNLIKTKNKIISLQRELIESYEAERYRYTLYKEETKFGDEKKTEEI